MTSVIVDCYRPVTSSAVIGQRCRWPSSAGGIVVCELAAQGQQSQQWIMAGGIVSCDPLLASLVADLVGKQSGRQIMTRLRAGQHLAERGQLCPCFANELDGNVLLLSLSATRPCYIVTFIGNETLTASLTMLDCWHHMSCSAVGLVGHALP